MIYVCMIYTVYTPMTCITVCVFVVMLYRPWPMNLQQARTGSESVGGCEGRQREQLESRFVEKQSAVPRKDYNPFCFFWMHFDLNSGYFVVDVGLILGVMLRLQLG